MTMADCKQCTNAYMVCIGKVTHIYHNICTLCTHMCMCMFVRLQLCVYISVTQRAYAYIYVYLSICVCVYVHVCLA